MMIEVVVEVVVDVIAIVFYERMCVGDVTFATFRHNKSVSTCVFIGSVPTRTCRLFVVCAFSCAVNFFDSTIDLSQSPVKHVYGKR